MYSFEEVKEFDPEIAAAISDELGRQRDNHSVYCAGLCGIWKCK